MVLRLTRYITGHFGDESLQAINCTDTHYQKQRNRIAGAPLTQKNKCKKLALVKTHVKLQNPGIVAFYIWSGNGWAYSYNPRQVSESVSKAQI